MIGGPCGTLDHPPTKSMLMLPMWQCYPTKPLPTDPALINVNNGIPFAESRSQDARESTWAVGEQSYTESLDIVTDISIQVINPRKKRDAKTFIL